MARPHKIGLDYFSFDIDFFADVKIRRIKKDCGISSLGILICLLCNIYKNGYYILSTDDMQFLIADDLGVKEGAVAELVKVAIKYDFFDKNMAEKYNILTSKSIQNRYLNGVARRESIDMIAEYCLVSVEGFDNVNVVNKPPDKELMYTETELMYTETPLSGINVYRSTQSKVNKSILNNTPLYISPLENSGEKPKKRKNFAKPTIAELKAYCTERKNSVDPEKFLDYYESNGWKVGKNPMKDWKAAVRTWERNDFGNGNNGQKPTARKKSTLDSGEENFEW